MASFADIISEARATLQDTVIPYRYSSSDLLVGANDAIRIMRKVRPDLFFGKYKTAIGEYAEADTFPVGLEYKMVVRDFVVGYAQLRESEDAGEQRANLFFTKFEKALQAL